MTQEQNDRLQTLADAVGAIAHRDAKGNIHRVTIGSLVYGKWGNAGGVWQFASDARDTLEARRGERTVTGNRGNTEMAIRNPCATCPGAR